ncbi:germinal-center associated nuclear protein-like [Crassostrea virginica]
MTYLLSQIADRGEDGKWGDWFDFLWNRTRGIRKEITLQQFCSTESTALLKKCVRFHIFCAERLCEEDMHSFDDKINNENMTKCLQTLK